MISILSALIFVLQSACFADFYSKAGAFLMPYRISRLKLSAVFRRLVCFALKYAFIDHPTAISHV